MPTDPAADLRITTLITVIHGINTTGKPKSHSRNDLALHITDIVRT